MSGFGSQGFGSSPYGIGTPAIATDLGGKLLKEAKTGKQSGSRRIDFATKDYAFDESGRTEGMPDVQQLVYLALATALKSSAVRSLGQRFNSLKVVSGSTDLEIRSLVNAALTDLIAAKRIRVNDARLVPIQPGAFVIRVFWTDLTEQRDLTTEI